MTQLLKLVLMKLVTWFLRNFKWLQQDRLLSSTSADEIPQRCVEYHRLEGRHLSYLFILMRSDLTLGRALSCVLLGASPLAHGINCISALLLVMEDKTK